MFTYYYFHRELKAFHIKKQFFKPIKELSLLLFIHIYYKEPNYYSQL